MSDQQSKMAQGFNILASNQSVSEKVRDDVRKRKDVGRGVKNNTLTLQNKDSDTQYVRLIQSIQSCFSEGALASETVKDNIALLV